jgi:CRISPR-associated endoribonuclease Cas6
MITSQVIFLKHISGSPHDISGKHIHGLFFKALERYDSKLSERLHGSASSRPFSLSYVYKGKNGYWFRIASWVDEICEAVFRYFTANPIVYIGDCVFSLIRTSTDPNESPWAARIDWNAFVKIISSTFTNPFWLEHFSPTAFKTGDSHLPLPVPQFIVNSVYRQLPDQLRSKINSSSEELSEILQLKRYEIRSIYNRKNQGSISSFLGKTQWQISAKSDKELVTELWLLLNFAFFSGIGVKTTQGMGMCRVIEKA